MEQYAVYKKHLAEYSGGFNPEDILNYNPEDADEEKMVWLSGFGSMREKYMTPEMIKRAFAYKGIFPFTPRQVANIHCVLTSEVDKYWDIMQQRRD